MCLVYDGNYPTAIESSNDSSYFTQRPSFDLFLPKEACKFTQRQSFDLFRLKEAWKFTQRSIPLGQCDGRIHKHTQRDRGRDTIIRHTARQAVWHQKKPWKGSTLYHWPMVVSQEEDR